MLKRGHCLIKMNTNHFSFALILFSINLLRPNDAYASVNKIFIGSDNGFLHVRCQVIIWNNAGLLSIRLEGTYFSEIQLNTFENVISKMAAILSRPQCIDKQRVLVLGHQGWNVRHGLCHIYMIYVYIWVVYSFCLFCCLFIIVTTQFVALYKPCKPKPKLSTYDPPGQPPPGRDPNSDT